MSRRLELVGPLRSHRRPSTTLQALFDLRANYPVLNDGFSLVQHGNWTHEDFLPFSNGSATERGLWSVSRGGLTPLQNFTLNDTVWFLYTNENTTITHSGNCTTDTGISRSLPFQHGCPKSCSILSRTTPWELRTGRSSSMERPHSSAASSRSPCNPTTSRLSSPPTSGSPPTPRPHQIHSWTRCPNRDDRRQSEPQQHRRPDRVHGPDGLRQRHTVDDVHSRLVWKRFHSFGEIGFGRVSDDSGRKHQASECPWSNGLEVVLEGDDR
jgi:hypothetical protein